MKLLAETSLGEAEIAAFVDGNPINHGKMIRGVPVLAPEKIRSMPQPILISTTLHEAGDRGHDPCNGLDQSGNHARGHLQRRGRIMIRVADYIANTLADRGVRHLFMVSGGGAMFLNDAFGAESRLKYVCNHHEQASAMAAEGFARVTGTVGVVNVTAGPGGINALNGVFGAWTDSIPMLIVSGQVKRETCVGTYDLPKLRQLGDQEVDIVRMVKGITKYAVLVTDPKTIRYHLERAYHLAGTGRPGPCWIDVPVDVQSSLIDPEQLPGYDPAEDDPRWDMGEIRRLCRNVVDRFRRAERPVILAGTGVRLSHGLEAFHSVIRKLGVPVTTAWTHDLIASDDPLFCGRQGSIGERAGNFTVQNSDCLLVIGARLPIRQISYNWTAFARHAYKIQVDVDAAELAKPTVKPDMPIHCDARLFLEELDRTVSNSDGGAGHHASWLAWCKERVRNILSCSRSTANITVRSTRTISSTSCSSTLPTTTL